MPIYLPRLNLTLLTSDLNHDPNTQIRAFSTIQTVPKPFRDKKLSSPDWKMDSGVKALPLVSRMVETITETPGVIHYLSKSKIAE